MSDFGTDDSLICYANETIPEIFKYDNYDCLFVFLEFSTLFHAFLLLFLFLYFKLRKQKKRVNQNTHVQDETSTETTTPEVRVSYPRLGRFLSLVTIKV